MKQLIEKKKIRAFALLSGGLDSTLAAKLMLDQGIEVIGLHMDIEPEKKDVKPEIERAAAQIGIPLYVADAVADLLKILKKPKHGFGQGANPCIDCHILQWRKASEMMQKHEIDFLITGEVLGQRPMSQHYHAMMMIEKEAGVKGLVVRPLSGLLLDATIPEEKGWIDRSKMLGINGRTRTTQIALAEKLGIREYPQPAGGCFLTQEQMGARVRDLKKFICDFNRNDLALVRLGRHFRINEKLRIIVGRNEQENKSLEGLAQPGDVIFENAEWAGPIVLARGEVLAQDKELIANITKRYGKDNESEISPVIARTVGGFSEHQIVSAKKIPADVINTFMTGV
jgi:tRNA U34 2-thiouridine synthase MnmA/TrmU